MRKHVKNVYTVNVEGELFYFESVEQAEEIAERYGTTWTYHEGEVYAFDGDEEFFYDE